MLSVASRVRQHPRTAHRTLSLPRSRLIVRAWLSPGISGWKTLAYVHTSAQKMRNQRVIEPLNDTDIPDYRSRTIQESIYKGRHPLHKRRPEISSPTSLARPFVELPLEHLISNCTASSILPTQYLREKQTSQQHVCQRIHKACHPWPCHLPCYSTLHYQHYTHAVDSW